MNFALLGDSPAVMPLVTALAAHPRHRLVAAALTGPLTGDVLVAVPAVRIVDRWETLLIDRAVEGVIVCGTADHVQEAVRRLAAEGKPLLIVPHAELATFYYELSLIRDDTRVPLVPAFPLTFDPAVAALRSELTDDAIGRVLHLQMERERPVDAEGQPPLLTSDLIDEALLADSDLLRSLGGNYDRVTAIRTGVIDHRAAVASVTHAGDGLAEATWRLIAVPPGGVAGVASSTSQSVARSAGDGEAPTPATPAVRNDRWVLTVTGSGGQRIVRSDATDSARQSADMLDAFSETAQGSPRGPAWGDLIRACDVVDAARRSVTRRRTIDIHFETTSERSQFKSHMTAIGCGVLFLTVLLVLGLMLLDSVVNLPPKLRLAAQIGVFLPVFVFLALQALIVLARPSERPPESGK